MGMIDRLRLLTHTDPTYQDAWARSVVTIPPFPRVMDPAMPWANIGGRMYPLGFNQTLQGNREEPPGDFVGFVDYMYRNNPVVFSCVDNRVKLFSEARFQYRRFSKGRPGDLFGDASLSLLERPWPGGTTGDLLSKMLQYADLEGDAFVLRLADRLVVLRPDWTTIVLDGSASDPRATVLGYAYHPNGPYSGDMLVFGVNEVAHFAPIPDPLTPHRGMSWITPVVREIMADTAASSHKLRFFEHGATVNLIVEFSEGKQSFEELKDKFNAGHQGAANSYKTLFTTPSMKVTPVGADLKQIDFKVTQGAGETRIAAAAGVPPVIVGLSEGLAAATYSNYGQARRRFADQTMRPLWRNVAGSLAQIIDEPGGAQLWYDDRDVSALQEDQQDAANILRTKVEAIVHASSGGFLRGSAISAVMSGDLTQLVEDPDWVSVQVQPSTTAPAVPQLTAPPARDDDARELFALAGRMIETSERRADAAERHADAAERRADIPPVVNVNLPEPAPAAETETILEYDEDGRVVKILEVPA
jgi:phage portal protein BeeE